MITSHPKRMRRRCPSAINDKTAADIIVNGFMSFAPASEKKHCKLHSTLPKIRNPAPLKNGVPKIKP
jgi:hypothetical protein